MAHSQINQHDVSESSYLESNLARNPSSQMGILSDYRNSIPNSSKNSHSIMQGNIQGLKQPPQNSNFNSCISSSGQSVNQCLTKPQQQQPTYFNMPGTNNFLDQQNQAYPGSGANNNYGSDGMGVYDMHQMDEMGNMLQLCSPNPHAGINQALSFQNFSSGSNYPTTNSNSILLNSTMIKQPSDDKSQSFGIPQNFNNNQRDVFIRDNAANQYLQIDQNQFSANSNHDLQENFNMSQYNNQKLPSFNEIQNQTSRQKEYRNSTSNNLSIFNQGQSKQHNSPYFGSQMNQPTQPSPKSVARIDLIMCHGQQEQMLHEKQEKSNTNSQMAFSNNVGSMNLSTQTNSSNPNNMHRDSIFSDKQNATQISPIQQNIKQSQSQLGLSEVDEQDQKNIQQILFTPNGKDKIGLNSQLEVQNNLYSKDLFEHVTKSREQIKHNQQIFKRQDNLDFKENTNQHSHGSHLDMNETFNKNNGSFSKFDYSPQFQSFHQLMNNPLSPSEYTQSNFHFNEDHHHFLRVNGQLQNKKQRSSNSQFDLTFSKQESVDQISFGHMIGNQMHKHGLNNVKQEQSNLDSSHGGQRQSSGSHQFCQQCHQESLRRLLDDEQKKLKELEAIKIEKAQILNNVAKYRQEQQDNFMLFFCDRVEGSMTRKIGRLTLQERYIKIKKFKEKKQNRIWKKKVSYDCRKQVADKRLRIKGRFIRKEDQKKLLQEIFGNGELFPEDIKQFNSGLTQLMSEYQKQKMQRNQLGPKDFLIHKQDEKGIRHSFFDFKKFSNFIEEEEEDCSTERKAQSLNNSKIKSNEEQKNDKEGKLSKQSPSLLSQTPTQKQIVEEEKNDGLGIIKQQTQLSNKQCTSQNTLDVPLIQESKNLPVQIVNQKQPIYQLQQQQLNTRSSKRDLKHQLKKDNKK
ncbi:cct motif family protein [Stylonychia lemnae]|uniref:Cct motif family protein n=1 Tax=Stylonychia lemnae TaxID=5949 RepID=A0A078A786_STYLE|nr:cct motif family protein [Stylonychia lemnae]|eukprot:CDW78115.1 cct motif family protein [Stylonychia lemnae]